MLLRSGKLNSELYDQLKKMNYGQLKKTEARYTDDLALIQEIIQDYEHDPKNDDEVGSWSESEYLRMVDEAERNFETEW
jgi:hypothetical protein